jgi:hypothetical protein
MADAAEGGGTQQSAWLGLNSDGESHLLLNAASFFTLLIGLVSFALGMYLRYGTSSFGVALAAGLTGLAALVVGLVSQMMSATREERILLVCGMVAAFVGLALGLAHGGFS